MGTTPDEAEAIPAALAETQAETTLAPEIARGASLGRYVVLDRIGTGSMGLVVTAFDPTLDRKVAIKLVRPDLTGSTMGRQRLVREAQAMARLSHPNVVTVFEVGTVDDHVFLAMEYVAGATLDQWCAAPGRTRRAIIAAYVAAGRGLAAAHKAGIVHRDFKPNNVLVSADDHVRVADFGLATGVVDDAPVSIDSALDDLAMTATGAVLGTPAYMAPEQHRAQVIDARSDQFAFCAALYQAVYGHLPFAGDDYPTYSTNVLAGKIRDASHPDVPARARRAIVRGLSTDPAARFPAMGELLEELDVAPPARRWLPVAVVGGAIGIAAIAIAVLARSATVDPCAHAVPTTAGIWDADVRGKIERAFAATGPRGAPTAQRLTALVERRVADIGAMRHDACAATHIRHVQSAELLDRRIACLDERTAEIAALTAMYGATTTTADVDGSVMSVMSLPPLAGCADREALLAAIRPPDPRVRAQAHQLGKRIAEVEAMRAAGKLGDSEAVLVTIVRDADQLGDPDTQARAHSLLGAMKASREDFAGAMVEAQRAIGFAAIAHDDVELARALIEIYGDEVQSDGRTAQAEVLAPIVDAAVTRAGDPFDLRAYLDNARGVAALNAGDYAGAVELFQSSARGYAIAFGPSPRLTMSITNTGTAMHYAGQLDAARAEFERAIAMQIDMVGEDHPNVALALSALAGLLDDMGKRDEALADYRRVEAINDKTLAPDNPRRASTYSDLGVVLDNLGRYDEAIAMHRKAVAILELTPDADVRLSYALGNLGVTEHKLGDDKAALAAYQRAIDLATASEGADHPHIAHLLMAMADPIDDTDPGRAHELLLRALTIRRAKLGDNPETADTIVALGSYEEDHKRFVDALALYDEAIAMYEKTDTTALAQYAIARESRGRVRLGVHRAADAVPDLVAARDAQRANGNGPVTARIELLLAQAQWAVGPAASRADAIASAQRALDVATQAQATETAAAATTWLAAHRPE